MCHRLLVRKPERIGTRNHRWSQRANPVPLYQMRHCQQLCIPLISKKANAKEVGSSSLLMDGTKFVQVLRAPLKGFRELNVKKTNLYFSFFFFNSSFAHRLAPTRPPYRCSCWRAQGLIGSSYPWLLSAKVNGILIKETPFAVQGRASLWGQTPSKDFQERKWDSPWQNAVQPCFVLGPRPCLLNTKGVHKPV